MVVEHADRDRADRSIAAKRDRAAWRISSGYAWSFGAVGAMIPFATLYYRNLGFSGLQVGALAALPALAVAISGPVWGAVADARSIHRLVLRVAMVAAAVLALAVTQVSSFLPILLLMGLLAFFQAPVPAILDGYAVTFSERLGRSYGSLRVWGTLGYTAVALIVGRLMGDRVSRLFLVAYAVCLVLGLLSVLGLPSLGERSGRSLFGGLRVLLRNRPLVVLLLSSYLMSSGAAIMYGFLGIHLEELGGTANLIGIAVALAAASELPVVAFGGWFLSLLGASRLIALAIVVYAARFVAYALIPNPEWTLPVQALHGLSYGAFLVASVTLAHRLAGREHAATAQSLLAATSFGFGTITGSLLGGALLDRIGTVGLFWIAAAVMLLTLAVFVAGERTANGAASEDRRVVP